MVTQPKQAAWLIGLAALGAVIVLIWTVSMRDGDTDVVVIGDSVTYLSGGPIDDALDGDVELIAEPGYTSADLLPGVEQAVAGLGDEVREIDALVLVGYNDVTQSGPDVPGLDELVAVSTRFRCAVWLTLPTRSPGNEGALRADAAAAWNARLQGLVAAHPSLHLATAWGEAVDASAPGELVVEDGVHPTVAGAERLAAVMSDALDAACAPDG